MVMVAADEVKMPRGLMRWMEERGVETYETGNLREVIGDVDVIYDTRVQKEWFTSEEEYLRVSKAMRITPEIMSLARPEAVLMHPLPRVDEISPDVDQDPRAAYFRQVGHGVWVRGALMTLILSK